MNWLIIGSTAAVHWFPDWPRKPLDIDILTPAKIIGNNSKICVVDTCWHDAAQAVIDASEHKVFADPSILFTLKFSHAHWDVKWDKTMHDIAWFQAHNVPLNMELYEILFKTWSSIHGPKRVNMNQKVDVFFEDAVNRDIDHEELHEIVAFNDQPMHKILRPDHGTVWCSEEKFNKLTPDLQAQVALEEMMVVAVERKRLTTQSKQSEIMIGMSYAHKQLCTSMATGWFARYLILNRNNLLFNWRSLWLAKMKTSLFSISTLKITH